MARRIPALALLLIAAGALVYALYMLIAPTELILRDAPGGTEIGRVTCSTMAVTGELKTAGDTFRGDCAEAEASEQQHALVAGAVVLVAGAAGVLLLRRRAAVLTPQ